MSSEALNLSKPPLNLLVDPTSVRGHKPWEIDISKLLELFLSLMTQRGRLDMRLCGSAALSSALLYRFKVESLFLFEKLLLQRKQISYHEPPQIMLMPFRYELYSTSVEDLINALSDVLNEILTRGKPERPVHRLIEAEPIIEMDPFITNIQELLSSFRKQINQALIDQDSISFRELVTGMTVLEEVRTFILLLFLGMEGVIRLTEDEMDIRIVPAHGNVTK